MSTPPDPLAAQAEMATLSARLQEKDPETGQHVVAFESLEHRRLRDRMIELQPVAYPAPETAAGPSPAEVLAKLERKGQLATLRQQLLQAPEGSQEAVDLRNAIIAFHAEESAQSAPSAPSVPSHPLSGTLPPSLARTSWALELLTAAEGQGLEYSIGPLLHVTERERQTGVPRSYEQAYRELVQRHGQEHADEIIGDARAMESLMTKQLRQYLTAERLLNNPDVIEYAAKMRRISKGS